MVNGEWEMATDALWTRMVNGKWRMGNDVWRIVDGKSYVTHSPFTIYHLPIALPFTTHYLPFTNLRSVDLLSENGPFDMSINL